MTKSEKLAEAIRKVTSTGCSINKAAKEGGIDRRLLKRCAILSSILFESNSLRETTTCRALDQPENEPLPDRKKGRKSIVSPEAIEKTRTHAEERDLAKDSATSSNVVLDVLDSNRRTELEARGGNRLGSLKPISLSTKKRPIRLIAPNRVKSGGVQSTSRQRALLDPRNATLSTWSAVTTGVVDPRQIHSWDELSVELNGFGKKKKLYMTKAGAAVLKQRNLNPATTLSQGKRRTIKFGISEC